jgi:hypothetical protein
MNVTNALMRLCPEPLMALTQHIGAEAKPLGSFPRLRLGDLPPSARRALIRHWPASS